MHLITSDNVNKLYLRNTIRDTGVKLNTHWLGLTLGNERKENLFEFVSNRERLFQTLKLLRNCVGFLQRQMFFFSLIIFQAYVEKEILTICICWRRVTVTIQYFLIFQIFVSDLLLSQWFLHSSAVWRWGVRSSARRIPRWLTTPKHHSPSRTYFSYPILSLLEHIAFHK